MRRAREIWVGIVGQYERSGLTQEAFAADRGFPVATLRWWISRLRRDGKEAAPLLPVRVLASTAPSARGAGDGWPGIEVTVGDALRVRFPDGTPPSMIAELVAL